MWVRHQEKCLITNGTSTYYIGNVDYDEWDKIKILFSNGASINENHSIVMATYSSVGKAMKVMDMLEEHIYYRMNNISKIIAFKGLLISIPIVIFIFWFSKKLLHLYSYFIGEELFLADELANTIFFILFVMDHILKVFGITGAGKDKVSQLENLIERNKKNGYIQEVICFSKTGADPADYTIIPVDKINKDFEEKRNKLKMAYVTKLTFRTSDCERYDTHFMRKLGEKLSEETKIEFANIPRWSRNMTMTEDDIAWMGYIASKEMFGIEDSVFEEIRYGDGYLKYINQNR